MITRKTLATGLILALVFACSIAVRLRHLKGPLRYRHELWLTAYVLCPLEIWSEEGLGRSHYAARMTYPGKANKHINNQASIRFQMDAEGNYYYTSYPPFSLYFLNAFFQGFRIHPNVSTLRIFNLLWHFLSALLVFRIIQLITGAESKSLPLAALCGFVVYLFTPETLWVQSNLYFCDIFAQVFFVAGVYLLLERIKNKSTSKLWLLGFGIFTFLFAYTDWLGVMFAVGTFVFACIYADDSALHWLPLVMAASILAAVTITFAQYSQIAGLKAFASFALQKYLYRSGFGNEAAFQVHLWSWVGWLRLFLHYMRGYLPDFVLITVWLLLKDKRQVFSASRKTNAALFLTTFLPVILHHVAFFNFTAIHDFSVLKAAPFIAILAGLVAASVCDLGPGKTRNFALHGLALTSLALFCVWGVNAYEGLIGPPYYGYQRIGAFIEQNSRSEEVVFIHYPPEFIATHPDAWEEPYPAVILYAHRNIARWKDQDSARELVRENGLSAAVLFTTNSSADAVISVRHLKF